MTAPLPLPDDPAIQRLIDSWPAYLESGIPFPRSYWLSRFEIILRRHYPDASSKQRTLTARLAAPFPLAKPGVP